MCVNLGIALFIWWTSGDLLTASIQNEVTKANDEFQDDPRIFVSSDAFRRPCVSTSRYTMYVRYVMYYIVFSTVNLLYVAYFRKMYEFLSRVTNGDITWSHSQAYYSVICWCYTYLSCCIIQRRICSIIISALKKYRNCVDISRSVASSYYQTDELDSSDARV